MTAAGSPCIGLMSGTSADGLDAVLVEFDGDRPRLRAQSCTPFDAELRRDMETLRTASADEIHRYGVFDRRLAAFCADAVEAIRGDAQVRAVGWPGHTVRHCPDAAVPFSLQAGDPATLARLTGLPVVAEFRRADLAAGGQGAPLAPLFHRAFFAAADEQRAVLNLGGIANLSLLPTAGDVLGFDTGPGNCLMDEWAQRHRGEAFDRDGDWAQGGRVVAALLERLLQTKWLAEPPPKSTGRELFHLGWLDAVLAEPAFAEQTDALSAQDVQATLAAFTAHSACDALKARAPDCRRLFVCGGGAHNLHLVELLRDRLGGLQVETTEALGLPPEWVEATGMAWLARQRILERPTDLGPITGGARRRLGVVFAPD